MKKLDDPKLFSIEECSKSYTFFPFEIYRMNLESMIEFKKELLKERKVEINDRKEVLLKVNVILSQIIRMVIRNTSEEHGDISLEDIIEMLVEHGFSVMEHNYTYLLTEIRKLRDELEYPQVNRIRNFLVDTKVNADVIYGPEKKKIVLRKNLYSAIRVMGEKLGIEFSSMVRLCMYHSFLTSISLPKEIINESLTQVEKLRLDLLEAKLLLILFKQGEDMWKEKKHEWMMDIDKKRYINE